MLTSRLPTRLELRHESCRLATAIWRPTRGLGMAEEAGRSTAGMELHRQERIRKFIQGHGEATGKMLLRVWYGLSCNSADPRQIRSGSAVIPGPRNAAGSWPQLPEAAFQAREIKGFNKKGLNNQADWPQSETASGWRKMSQRQRETLGDALHFSLQPLQQQFSALFVLSNV